MSRSGLTIRRCLGRAIFCLAILVTTACGSTGVSRPEPQADAAPAGGRLQQLLDDGADALRERRWMDAAQLFETAYAEGSDAQRRELAFFWGAALFQQGAALLRTNSAGSQDQIDDARSYFEQAEAIVEGAEHPMRDDLLQAIRRFLEGPTPMGPMSAAGHHGVETVDVDASLPLIEAAWGTGGGTYHDLARSSEGERVRPERGPRATMSPTAHHCR